MIASRFTVGMKVVKIYHAPGFTERSEDTVISVRDGVVCTAESGGGITYDERTGRERENFFPPAYFEIIPPKLPKPPVPIHEFMPALWAATWSRKTGQRLQTTCARCGRVKSNPCHSDATQV